jgi:hypothetical protein
MELASYLAGERWSDHPRCTHPLLAGLARLVNDYTSDAGRQRLAALIPSVIGLTSDDLRVDARIALRAAIVGLPVVSADRQRVLAVSVFTCERVLADLEDASPGRLADESRSALAGAPEASRWAYEFTRQIQTSRQAFHQRGAPTAVRCACQGIAEACIPDPDGLLYQLLVETIRECELCCADHRGAGPGRAARSAPAGSSNPCSVGIAVACPRSK